MASKVVQSEPAVTAEKTYEGLVPQQLMEMYRLMILSRRIDDREILLKRQQKIHFQISCAGHEALLLAAAANLRAGYDWFFPYYRDRALCLALGVTPGSSVSASRRRRRRSGLGWPPDAVALGQPRAQYLHHLLAHRHSVSAGRGLRRGRPLLHPPSRGGRQGAAAITASSRTCSITPTKSPTSPPARAPPRRANSGSR